MAFKKVVVSWSTSSTIIRSSGLFHTAMVAVFHVCHAGFALSEVRRALGMRLAGCLSLCHCVPQTIIGTIVFVDTVYGYPKSCVDGFEIMTGEAS